MESKEVAPESSKRQSHLVTVDKMPEDIVPITSYGKHTFNNLYYSQTNNKLYQQYPKRIREITINSAEHGKKNQPYVRSDKNQTIYLSIKKLMKIIEKLQENPNDDKALEELNDLKLEMEIPKKKKSDAKVDFVKGKNMKSQVGVITDAKAALKATTTAKRSKRSGKIDVTVEDMKL